MIKRANPISGDKGKTSERALAAVEKRLGLPMPAQLRTFYAAHNGGRPLRRISIVEASDDVYRIQFRGFYAIVSKADGRELEDSYDAYVRKQKVILPDRIPFGENDGGDVYCVDVEGRVYYCALDTNKPLPNQGLLVANSLQDFLELMLTTDEADDDPRWNSGTEPASKTPAPKARALSKSAKKEMAVVESLRSKRVGVAKKSAPRLKESSPKKKAPMAKAAKANASPRTKKTAKTASALGKSGAANHRRK